MKIVDKSENSKAESLDCDYLILGAGAMGMAFADVILTEDATARIIFVDRRPAPGGHWNDSYPFVRLHQPAAFYGLNSTQLGQGGSELTSGPEIVAYFNNAMDRFLASGRVRFLPMTDYRGDGNVVSLVEPNRVMRVTAHRRIVDSTYMRVEIPAVCPPRYTVDDDVTVVPPNGLTCLDRPYERYVIVGAGKTGVDAITFLLDRGVAPERIQWITPNDAWLWNRGSVQPGHALATMAAFVASAGEAATIDDIYLQLERQNIVCRVDPNVLPTKWRCATVDRVELDKLRSVKNVVRNGRVKRLRKGRIELEGGAVECPDDTLFVDCTANGLGKLPARPLFSDGLITVQPVFMCQQTFSAALIAHLELLDTTDEARNRICVPVPHPELKEDLPSALLDSVRNMLNCNRAFPLWLRRSRLYLGHHEPLGRYLTSSAKFVWLTRKVNGGKLIRATTAAAGAAS